MREGLEGEKGLGREREGSRRQKRGERGVVWRGEESVAA